MMIFTREQIEQLTNYQPVTLYVPYERGDRWDNHGEDTVLYPNGRERWSIGKDYAVQTGQSEPGLWWITLLDGNIEIQRKRPGMHNNWKPLRAIITNITLHEPVKDFPARKRWILEFVIGTTPDDKYKALKGRNVYVSHILTVKPQYSDEPGYGYILAGAEYDPDDREECNSVGRVTSHYKDGICTVSFSDFNEHTCAFAHVDDLILSDQESTLPTNPGLTFV
jgi:hypothetical protein